MHSVITEGSSLHLFCLWINEIGKYLGKVNKALGMMING